jgi:toxin HigB-1
VIKSFRNKALKRFWERNDVSGLRPDWLGRISRQLDLLDEAIKPDDMDVTSYGFHALKGNQKGRYALTVSRNWRLTFGWDEKDAIDVDLEDYHGK